ncbi:MAG: dihydroorotase [Clostridia bacterium]|nr:dihydroorotase [Clostridia bacterium]
MSLRLANARLIDCSGERQGDVCIDGGKIVSDMPCDETVDVGGLAVLPALIDIHCHLRDPGYPKKETMETGMRAAVAGGFGTLVAMANTLPVIRTPEQVMANQKKARDLGLCTLIQAAAAGMDLKDETPTDYEALSKVTRVISNDGKTIFSDDFMRNLLLASQKYGFIVSTHCQPEREIVARDIKLLREVGGRLHVGHISRRETLDMIRKAKQEGLGLTCEVTPHHLFGYDNDYKVNPPLRTKDDVKALIEGISEGVIDCVGTDHAPHTSADKKAGMAGISNFDYALGVYIRVFTDNGIPLSTLSRMGALTPAALLGTGCARITSGQSADLILVDPDAAWTIRTGEMRSRSHNTPFAGRKVKGRVLSTMLRGEVVYRAGENKEQDG